MFDPRWRKLGRDLAAERGRVLLMVTAIAVSLAAVGAVLGAHAILTREIAVNYLGTRPASATLELPGGIDAALLSNVRRHPAVAEAEARDVILARARVGNDWRPLLLFVIDDFEYLKLNTFRKESGVWPPPEGTMLIERTAVSMLEARPWESVLVKTPNGPPRAVPISGLVHDPGLAPAWQEREGYGYITRATLAALGEAPVLHELRIEVRGRPREVQVVERAAAEVAARLSALGHPVHQIRVPPPFRHPHERQMRTILLMLIAFSGLAIVLSAILVATSLAAMLARQVREIGVMKTLGARSAQLAGLYAALVSSLGVVATLAALGPAVLGARLLAGSVSRMLNFTLTSASIPGWVFATVGAAGLLVPLLVALFPIARASRLTVRAAIDQYGVGAGTLRPGFSRLPRPLRSALRRPVRLLLTTGLLATGGAVFMMALDVSRGWERNLAKVYETRHYDVEIRFQKPQPGSVADSLRRVPGVRLVEPWGYSPAALARPGQVDVVRTYPDRGHGSLALLAPPADTRLIRFPLLAGRWLRPGDTDAVVLNHAVAAQAPGLGVGSPITVSVDGVPATWRVVGIVEEIGSMAAVYATDDSFTRVAGNGGGSRMLRIATSARTPEKRIEIIRAIDASLTRAGVGIESAVPLSELRTAVGDHIAILIDALVAMALVFAVVGTLGLGSSMGISVLERTRELAVMKAIGATPSRIVKALVAEALAIGGTSWLLAVALSVPLTHFVDRLVGNLGFLAPLPLVVAPEPIAIWLALVGVVAPLATWLPAKRAASLTVNQALAET